MEKLLENIFRSVNIALLNELARLCERMGDINIWEVIDAASTKPFGFMPFYPGPGIGGHCIQIDPYYLDWLAKAYDFQTKFIEIAAEINEDMPFYVRDLILKVISNMPIAASEANVLILGTTFKRDVEDARNSPAVKLIELLHKEGMKNVNFNDPFMKNIKLDDKIFRCQPLSEKVLRESDVVVIVTDHTSYDYEWITAFSKKIVDTRNATKKIKTNRERITLLGSSIKA
jgi:UDP-N-acetyl-D-glucosamine dehydrogenase